jgi:PAS domain S-box-containing protein
MIGRSVRRLIPPERQREEDQIQACIRSGKQLEHYRTVRVTKRGRRLELLLNISPVRNARGRVVGAKVVPDVN